MAACATVAAVAFISVQPSSSPERLLLVTATDDSAKAGLPSETLRWVPDESLDGVEGTIAGGNFVKTVTVRDSITINPVINPLPAGLLSAQMAESAATSASPDIPDDTLPVVGLGSVTVSDYGTALPDGTIDPVLRDRLCWVVIYRGVRDVTGPMGSLTAPTPSSADDGPGKRNVLAFVDPLTGGLLYEANLSVVVPASSK